MAVGLAAVVAVLPGSASAESYKYDEATRQKLRDFEKRTRVDETLTIGEVAAMTTGQRVIFVHDAASRRALELGLKHGGKVLECLGTEFRNYKITGKNLDLPRGMQAALRLIHRHNNNGGADRNASQQINHIVDLIAERACGVRQGADR